MKSIYGVLGILSLVFVGCGGSGDDDSGNSNGGKGGGGGTGGQTAGSTNPDVQKLIDACVEICKKELDCTPGVQIDCTGTCNANFMQAAQVPGSTLSCDVSAFETQAQDCAAGDCSALSDCQIKLDMICHN